MQNDKQTVNEESQVASKPGIDDVTIKVLYDNNPYANGLETAWGFSALISGTEKNILFDTGGNGQLLLNNMQKLDINPNDIDLVALSHIHGDHTGGLGSLLGKNSSVTVYLPASFPVKFNRLVQEHGAKIVEVEQPLKICENVYSTGRLGKLIKEHSLIIRTRAGSVIITGCAHPGILKMVGAARDLAQGDILLVLGGFHLEWAIKAKIEKTISAFKQQDVQYVGPCHCTGEKARSLFEKYFGQNYINIGAGKVITTADLH